MSRASEEVLGLLHDTLARSLLNKLKSGEYTAADLNVIRAFLKDNGIECLPQKNDTIRNILDSLPDSADLDTVGDTKLLS